MGNETNDHKLNLKIINSLAIKDKKKPLMQKQQEKKQTDLWRNTQ